MYRHICRLVRFVLRWFRVGDQALEIEMVDSAPEDPRSDRVYLITEDGDPWSVAMCCPCGCRELLFMSLLDGSPRWTVEVHKNGTMTLSPSIWRTTGCRSHFFLKRGFIRWCQINPPAGRMLKHG